MTHKPMRLALGLTVLLSSAAQAADVKEMATDAAKDQAGKMTQAQATDRVKDKAGAMMPTPDAGAAMIIRP